MVYTVSKSLKKGAGASLFAFNTKTETAEEKPEKAAKGEKAEKKAKKSEEKE